MVSQLKRDSEVRTLPVSAIGGIETWHDAAEFLAMGAGNIQVCTAAMLYGFKIVEDMIDGLNNWMDEKGYQKLDDFIGKAVPNVVDWQYLNLNYDLKARIDQELCIGCGRCYIACEDTSHQAISHQQNGRRFYQVIDAECVGCNLCAHVCPVPDCISMVPVDNGLPALDWTQHPNNPMRETTS
jgi:dihydropyrimidine dehydrogenase (NAD+) subunit PreA